MVKAEYRFEIFADYFQFNVQDELAEGDLSDAWTDEAVEDLLALTGGTIGVGTVRNMTVPVTVQLLDEAPDELFISWDRVNECSIEISSGRLIIVNCIGDNEAAVRISVAPGWYRARIYYGDLDTLSWNGLEGDDHYQIALWPTKQSAPPVRLKPSHPSTIL